MQHFQGMLFKWTENIGRFSNLHPCTFKNKVTIKPLKTESSSIGIETIFTEINLKNKKWLLYFNNNFYNFLLEPHLKEIQAQLDITCKKNEYSLIIACFNSDVSESTLSLFGTQS